MRKHGIDISTYQCIIVGRNCNKGCKKTIQVFMINLLNLSQPYKSHLTKTSRCNQCLRINEKIVVGHHTSISCWTILPYLSNEYSEDIKKYHKILKKGYFPTRPLALRIATAT